eukprot:3085133-Pleurochrysis_carterae.AAC.1
MTLCNNVSVTVALGDGGARASSPFTRVSRQMRCHRSLHCSLQAPEDSLFKHAKEARQLANKRDWRLTLGISNFAGELFGDSSHDQGSGSVDGGAAARAHHHRCLRLRC